MIICVLKQILHKKKSHFHPTTKIPNSSLLFAAALSLNGRIAVREAQRARKKHFWYPSQWRKMCFEYQRIKFQWKKWVKIFKFDYGKGRGGWPPHPPPYGQPDRKYPFSTPSLRNTHRSKSLLKTCFNVYYVKIANLIRKTGNQNYWHFSLLVPFGRGLELMWRTLA